RIRDLGVNWQGQNAGLIGMSHREIVGPVMQVLIRGIEWQRFWVIKDRGDAGSREMAFEFIAPLTTDHVEMVHMLAPERDFGGFDLLDVVEQRRVTVGRAPA